MKLCFILSATFSSMSYNAFLWVLMYVRASLECMYIILLSRIISVISIAGALLLLLLSKSVWTEVWEFVSPCDMCWH